MSASFASWGTAAVSTTTTVAPSYPASIAAGDLLVLMIGLKNTDRTVTTPTGWLLRTDKTGGTGSFGTDTGPTRVYMFCKIADGTESGTLSVTSTVSGGSHISIAKIARFTKSSTDAWDLNMVSWSGSDASTGTSWSTTESSDFPAGAIQNGDIILGVDVLPTDVALTWGSEALTVTGATFGAISNVDDSTTGSGNDLRVRSWTAAVTAANTGTSFQHTATLSGTTTNAAGIDGFMRIRANPRPGIIGAWGTDSEDVWTDTTGNDFVSPDMACRSGDLLVALVAFKPESATISVPTGWTDQGTYTGGTGSQAADTGQVALAVRTRIADATSTDFPTFTDASAGVLSCQMLRISKTDDSSFLYFDVAATSGSDASSGIGWSATMSSDPGIATNDLLVNIAVTPTDVAQVWSPESFTITGATLTSLWAHDDVAASGNDLGVHQRVYYVSSGTGSAAAAHTATLDTGTAGVSVLVRVRHFVASLVNDADTSAGVDATSSLSTTRSTQTDNPSAATEANTLSVTPAIQDDSRTTTEANTLLVTPATQADTGTGVDTHGIEYLLPGADTSTGVDMGTVAFAPPTQTDNPSAAADTESLRYEISQAESPASVEDQTAVGVANETENPSAVEAVTSLIVTLSSTDDPNRTETSDLLYAISQSESVPGIDDGGLQTVRDDADTATGADSNGSVAIGVNSADTSAGADAETLGVSLAPTTDTGSDVETEAAPTASLSSPDTSTGVDSTGSIGTGVASADTSTGVDATSVFVATYTGADTASDVESSPPPAVAVSSSDARTVVEATGGPAREISEADTSSAAETETQSTPTFTGGFPTVIIEFATDNDNNEALYAPTGYTDISGFVRQMSGDLRGRGYEIGRCESGTLTFQFDDSDGRFTPGSERSPYFPHVKAGRRLRVRGKNMVQPNIAVGGGKEQEIMAWESGPGTVAPTPVLGTHESSLFSQGQGEYHVEGTVLDGAATGWHRVLQFFVPVELGVRLAYSAYVWHVGGTQPAGTDARLELQFFDATGADLGGAYTEWTDTGSSPERVGVSCAPPGTTKYARLRLAVHMDSPASGDITYAMTGVQVEVPENLAPNPSGFWDHLHWYAQGVGGENITQDNEGAANANMSYEWEDEDVSFYTLVQRMVPGDIYTVTCEARKTGGPDVMLTVDDGQTGDILDVDNTWVQLTTVYTAERSIEDIKFLLQDAAVPGTFIKVRKLAIYKGEVESPALAGVNDSGVTNWEHPKAIFNGWTEDFKGTVGDWKGDASVVVNDRLSRLGEKVLSSVLKEALFKDEMDLIVPLSDGADAQAQVSQIGKWAEQGMTSLNIVHTRGDLFTSTYALGVEGPSGEDTAIQFTRDSSSVGYFIEVPWSADYIPEPGETTGPVESMPPVTTGKKYTKKYMATWSNCYGSDNAVISGQDTSTEIYQGDIGPGSDRRSLIGFNWQSIKKDLKGAKITSCKFTIKNIEWRSGVSKGYALFGTHWFDATKPEQKPTTYDPTKTFPRIWTDGPWNKGSTRTIELGIYIGKQFKSGAVKGIVLGPAESFDNAYRGTFASALNKSKPYLTIQYTK